MTTTSHYRICPLCEACCGLEVKTEGTKVIAIRGAANDVFSHGYLCPKGVSLKDLHEDPDRLRTPLIKRDGQFVEATWDEAFAEIEKRLLPATLAEMAQNQGALTARPDSVPAPASTSIPPSAPLQPAHARTVSASTIASQHV